MYWGCGLGILYKFDKCFDHRASESIEICGCELCHDSEWITFLFFIAFYAIGGYDDFRQDAELVSVNHQVSRLRKVLVDLQAKHDTTILVSYLATRSTCETGFGLNGLSTTVSEWLKLSYIKAQCSLIFFNVCFYRVILSCTT